MINSKKLLDKLPRPRSPRLLAVAALSMMANPVLADGAGKAATCDSQQLSRSTQKVLAPAVPDGYDFFGETSVEVDGKTAELLRFTRADKTNTHLGGEHVSYVLAPKGNLLGFTWMDDRFDGRQKQISQAETETIARDFLKCYAPDLLKNMRLLWVHAHDETIRTKAGKQRTLTGMKFKARDRSTGLYFWVIVGADRNVMIFERDIHWITFPGHRGTEKWLHDSWLSQRLDRVSLTFPQGGL